MKGDCVMKGYYKNPYETENTIINGWLRTGDLGYMDEEGFIYIVDRKKDLIICKGKGSEEGLTGKAQQGRV